MAVGQLHKVLRVLEDGALLQLQVYPTRSNPVALWSIGKQRKAASCWLTGVPLAVGDDAYRPVGNQDYRMKRIHPDAFEELGWRSGRAVLVRADGTEVAPRDVMGKIDLDGDSVGILLSTAGWVFSVEEGVVGAFDKILVYLTVEGVESPWVTVDLVPLDWDPARDSGIHLEGRVGS